MIDNEKTLAFMNEYPLDKRLYEIKRMTRLVTTESDENYLNNILDNFQRNAIPYMITARTIVNNHTGKKSQGARLVEINSLERIEICGYLVLENKISLVKKGWSNTVNPIDMKDMVEYLEGRKILFELAEKKDGKVFEGDVTNG